MSKSKPEVNGYSSTKGGKHAQKSKESLVLGLVFPIECRKNPRRPRILLFPDHPRYSRQDNRGQTRRIGSVSIFPTHPRFQRQSAIILDISSRKLKFLLSGVQEMDWLSFLLGSNPPPFPSQIKMASWTDRLIFSDISKIWHDRETSKSSIVWDFCYT